MHAASEKEHRRFGIGLAQATPILLAVLGILGFLAALGMAQGAARFSLLGGSAVFGTVAIGILLFNVLRRERLSRKNDAVAEMIEHDHDLGFYCGPDGTILHANAVARKRYGDVNSQPLAKALSSDLAGSEGIVYRLLHKALTQGYASEDLSGPSEGFRVSTRVIGKDCSIWRIERDEQALSAAHHNRALISFGRRNSILYMNNAARDLVGRRARTLEEIFEDVSTDWSGTRTLRTADGTKRVLVHLIAQSAGRSEFVLTPTEEPPEKVSPDADFDRLPVPLIQVSSNGTILKANREARSMLKLSQEHLGNLTETMEGLGRALTDWLSEAAKGRGLNRSEFLRLTGTDREVFVQVTLKPLKDSDSDSLMAVLNDATELKTLEAQFVQSQKMQAIGQLAGGVAHDFNNLLTAISGHCDLLLLRHDMGDPDYADLVQINQNANRAAALVNQLLAFSRKQTLRPEVMDLRGALSDLAHLLNRLVGEKTTLSLHHDPLLPHMRGDKRQMEQVIMNLVVNARDAMPEGGEITIETERRIFSEQQERDKVSIPPGTYVSVTVTDQGSGIPKDQLQKVFEPFYTTKRTGEGTGLGLSTVYGIVKQTGGFVFVDSVVGKGSCFTLLFPAYEVDAVEDVHKQEKPARKLPVNGAGVVLLVEDEAPVRAFAARALRLRGYTVVEAETAEEALSLLDDDSLEVDIFVSDVIMPGMDGPTWVRKAREARPDVRVVFISGYAEDALGEGHDAVPNSAFLAKPFSLNDLTETVHKEIQ